MKAELKGNKLHLGDKEIELTNEQLKELGVKSNPFDVKENDLVYFIDDTGKVNSFAYYEGDEDDLKNGRCCSSRKLMEQKALRQNLNDRLWKFTIENGWSDDLWEDGTMRKFYIIQDRDRMRFYISDRISLKTQGTIYFISEKIAQRAIDEIVKPYMEEHPEFVW